MLPTHGLSAASYRDTFLYKIERNIKNPIQPDFVDRKPQSPGCAG